MASVSKIHGAGHLVRLHGFFFGSIVSMFFFGIGIGHSGKTV
jgi:hypothetical protein